MDELIGRSFRRQASEAEEQRLSAWRAADPENEAYYQDVIWLLEAADGVVRRTPVPAAPDPAEVLARAEGRPAGHAVARRRARLLPWGAGAALLAAAAVATVLLVRRPALAPGFDFAAGEFVTGPGEMATVVLGDGSVVRLGPESRLGIVGTESSREVFLTGRAFFSVTRMPDHPFRVRTPAGDAVVLGTRFELRADQDDARLVVVEGSVALGAEGTPVVVGSGEMSRMSSGTATAPVRVDDVGPLIDWLGRFVAFQATPLEQAAVELERVYGVRIEIADSALATQTLTGVYAEPDFTDLLAIICGVLEAQCAVRDGVVTMDRSP